MSDMECRLNSFLIICLAWSIKIKSHKILESLIFSCRGYLPFFNFFSSSLFLLHPKPFYLSSLSWDMEKKNIKSLGSAYLTLIYIIVEAFILRIINGSD